MANRSIINSTSIVAVCVFGFVLSSCSSNEQSALQSPTEISVESVCVLIQDEDWDAARRNFKRIRLNILNSDMDRKFFISAKVGQLERDSLAISNGDIGRVSQIKNFCDGVRQNKPLVKLAEEIKSKSVDYNPISNENDTSITQGPSDYLRPLNDKFPHWTRDVSGPLTGSRSDFGIVDVLYNANSKCSIWIFSSFGNFVKFNNAWGNTFSFNYPSEDRFGNTYVTENSIYSTTCAMEYSDVFG